MRSLIVDGYNIVHAWPSLNLTMRTRGLEDARRQLITALAEYAAQTGVVVTVVFDGQARPGGLPTNEHQDGVTVLFGTKLASADHIIERAAYQASQRGEGADVVVATDDRLERDVVGGMGVATMGARALEAEVTRVASDMTTETRRMRDDSRRTTRVEDGLDPEVRARLERIRRGEDR
jgi:predicted RNA-binding protein with PIN domain